MYVLHLPSVLVHGDDLVRNEQHQVAVVSGALALQLHLWRSKVTRVSLC